MTDDQPDVPTRDKILHTSKELFLERGFSSTPLSAIAARVELTKPALYYHFANKNELLHAIVDPIFESIEALLEETPEVLPTKEERWQFMVAYAEVLMHDTGAVMLLSREGSSTLRPLIYSRIMKHHDAVLQRLCGSNPDVDTLMRSYVTQATVEYGLVAGLRQHGPITSIALNQRRRHILSLAREIYFGGAA